MLAELGAAVRAELRQQPPAPWPSLLHVAAQQGGSAGSRQQLNRVRNSGEVMQPSAPPRRRHGTPSWGADEPREACRTIADGLHIPRPAPLRVRATAVTSRPSCGASRAPCPGSPCHRSSGTPSSEEPHARTRIPNLRSAPHPPHHLASSAARPGARIPVHGTTQWAKHGQLEPGHCAGALEVLDARAAKATARRGVPRSA